MSRTAHIAALVAVALASAGTTATAAKLVTGKDVRNGSLTGADVKDRSLGGADLKRGGIPADRLTAGARKSLEGQAGPAGATGPQGPQGPQGAKGDPGAFKTIVTRSATASFTGGDGVVGQAKTATALCQAGEQLVSGGYFAPTATAGGDPQFVVTGQAPVASDGSQLDQGEAPGGWKVTVVRNDDLLGLVTSYALCAK